MNRGMMTRVPRIRKSWLAASAIAVCLSSNIASAQTDEQRAGARVIATEGATAFKEGRYKDAVELFGKAESLVHAPPHLLFLARSHAKLGQFVKAREAYLKILKEQLPANAPVAFRDAQTAAADEVKSVEPHIGSLTIAISGAENAKDLTLSLDGAPVSSVMVGVPLPIDPGTHQITATASGFKATPVSVTLKDAERQTANLALTPDTSAVPLAMPGTPPAPAPNTAAAPPPMPPPGAPPPEQPSAGGPSPVLAYVALGVGVVGLGAGTLFALQSKSKRSDADSAANQLPTTCGSPCSADNPAAQHVASLDDSARSAKTIAIVSYVVGGVGVATGVTLLVLGKKHKDEAPASATISPWLGLGSAGVNGTF
jgi:hypothetical protein